MCVCGCLVFFFNDGRVGTLVSRLTKLEPDKEPPSTEPGEQGKGLERIEALHDTDGFRRYSLELRSDLADVGPHRLAGAHDILASWHGERLELEGYCLGDFPPLPPPLPSCVSHASLYPLRDLSLMFSVVSLVCCVLIIVIVF